MDPFIYFRKFEPEKPPYSVSGEASLFNPSVNRILGYPKVGGHVFDTDPAFLSDH